MRRCFAWTLMCLAWLPVPLAAQTASDSENHDALVEIYKLMISQELCDFAITDDQAAALVIVGDRLEEKLSLTEVASQKLYGQIAATLERQRAAGLCNPKGEWAKTYRAAVAKLGN